jgi:hypothetical protein
MVGAHARWRVNGDFAVEYKLGVRGARHAQFKLHEL